MALIFKPATGIDQHLEAAMNFFDFSRKPDVVQEAYFAEALYTLIGLEVSKSAGMKLSLEDLRLFRANFARQLLDRPRMLAVFEVEVSNNALIARSGGWYRASLGRSVLQILLDDFSDTPVMDLIDLDELDEIDDLLREAAPDAPPLPPGDIPPGLPASHWWWTAPRGGPEFYPEL